LWIVGGYFFYSSTTTEQNLEPIEGALEGLQESLVAYEEAAKRANNPDGA
jgi:hypothetical protein